MASQTEERLLHELELGDMEALEPLVGAQLARLADAPTD